MNEQEVINENARQQRVSFSWMTKNLGRYRPSSATSQLMADYINARGLPWEEDSLEEAFNALVASGQVEEAENSSEPVLKATPIPTPELPPWGFQLTRQAVKEMDAATLRAHMLSKQYGREFSQAVNDLRITKGEIQ